MKDVISEYELFYLFTVALTSLIIARDVLLVTAGFYIRYLSLPPPVSYISLLSNWKKVTQVVNSLTKLPKASGKFQKLSHHCQNVRNMFIRISF